MVTNLLALILLSQVPIPATTVPPTAERTVVFQDRGRVYLVGVESGRVQYVDNAPAPNPSPDDDDTAPPVPPGPVSYAWATVAIERNDSERNAWRDSKAIRDAVTAKGARIAFYSSDEADIDRLGIRPHITRNGWPTVILQDAAGKVVLSKRIETEAELLEVLK